MKRSLLVGMLEIILAALLCAPACAAGVSFVGAPGSPYVATGRQFTPNGDSILGGAAVGDFNGDGIDDLAVVDTGAPVSGAGESVTILLGHREGGLTVAPGSPAEVFSGGMVSGDGAIAAGDFNHDGKLDLAVMDNGNSEVWILLGDGAGHFHVTGTPIPYSCGSEPNAVAVGDFTGNGVQDLAFACYGAGVYVLLGNGSGGFALAPGSPFAVPGEAKSLAAGRFDSDGLSDLAVTTLQSQVIVEMATGNGRFEQDWSPLASSGVGTSIVASDLTGNGKTDLAITSDETGNVTVLLDDGAGHFTPAAGSPIPVPGGTGPTPSMPSSIVAGNFNGDDLTDLAVANFNPPGDGVVVFEGDGRGGFASAPGSPIPAHGNPEPLLTGDFNGDGRADLAAVNDFQGTVTVLENTSGKVGPPPTSGSEEPKPPSEPQPPHGGVGLGPTRAEIHARLAATLRSIAAQARLHLPIGADGIGFGVQIPAAGVVTVEWYAARRGRRGGHRRPVLLASGAVTLGSKAPGEITLYLTPVGKRIWGRDRRTLLRLRATFFGTGRGPVSAAKTVVAVARR